MIVMWIAIGLWVVITLFALTYGYLSAKADTFIPRCRGCGHYGPTPLRYRNLRSGFRYCSQECAEKDPNWPDETEISA